MRSITDHELAEHVRGTLAEMIAEAPAAADLDTMTLDPVGPNEARRDPWRPMMLVAAAAIVLAGLGALLAYASRPANTPSAESPPPSRVDSTAPAPVSTPLQAPASEQLSVLSVFDLPVDGWVRAQALAAPDGTCTRFIQPDVFTDAEGGPVVAACVGSGVQTDAVLGGEWARLAQSSPVIVLDTEREMRSDSADTIHAARWTLTDGTEAGVSASGMTRAEAQDLFDSIRVLDADAAAQVLAEQGVGAPASTALLIEPEGS